MKAYLTVSFLQWLEANQMTKPPNLLILWMQDVSPSVWQWEKNDHPAWAVRFQAPIIYIVAVLQTEENGELLPLHAFV